MVKCHHDWNSHVKAWESDGRVFREPEECIFPLMEVFALDFLHFDGLDRTELRGTVTLEDDGGVHTLYSSDQFRAVNLGRFDALKGGDFSQGEKPLDAEYDVLIRTDLVDKTHGELFLMSPLRYWSLQLQGDDFTQRREPHHNEAIMWNTGQRGLPGKLIYDSLCRFELVGPHCALNVLYAAYENAAAATFQLTFVAAQQDYDIDICGKVTARNTVLTDPDAYSTLFARTNYDYASLGPGDSVPLLKPSVVVPATSSLLLDLDLEYRVPGSHGSSRNFLKSKSSFQVPTFQTFLSVVDILSPDADGAVGMLKVEVKWWNPNP